MFDIDICFEINGKKVDLDHFGDELEIAVLNEMASNVKEKLKSVVCKTHNERPIVKIIGANGGELSWEIGGCCQQLINDATAKLK